MSLVHGKDPLVLLLLLVLTLAISPWRPAVPEERPFSWHDFEDDGDVRVNLYVFWSEKAAAIEQTGAELLLAGDLGCLMNMAGKLSRRGSAVRCFHTIEVLAGMGDCPAIGEEG
jgi:hypothetical protein